MRADQKRRRGRARHSPPFFWHSWSLIMKKGWLKESESEKPAPDGCPTHCQRAERLPLVLFLLARGTFGGDTASSRWPHQSGDYANAPTFFFCQELFITQ